VGLKKKTTTGEWWEEKNFRKGRKKGRDEGKEALQS